MQEGTSIPGRAVAGSEADDDGGWRLSGWRLCDDPPLLLSIVLSLCHPLCFFFFFLILFPSVLFSPLPFLEALRWPFIGPNKRWFFSTSLPSWDEDKSCWGVSLLLGLGHQQSCHGWTVGDGFRSEIQRRVVGWGRPDWFENRGKTKRSIFSPGWADTILAAFPFFCRWFSFVSRGRRRRNKNVKRRRSELRRPFFNLTIEIITSCNQALIHGNFSSSFFFLISPRDKLQLDPCI